MDFIKKTVEIHDAYLKMNFGNIFVAINLKNKNKNDRNYKCRSRDEKTLRIYMKDPQPIKVKSNYFIDPNI